MKKEQKKFTIKKIQLFLVISFIVLLIPIVIFTSTIRTVNAQTPIRTSDVIKVITPSSISCYGADHPRPHFENRPIFSDVSCDDNYDVDRCKIIGQKQIFVNTLFKVGDEDILYKGERLYCAHKRIIHNPTTSSFKVDPSSINVAIESGGGRDFEILQAVNGEWKDLFIDGSTTIPVNSDITVLFFATKQPSETIKYDIHAYSLTEDPFFNAFDTTSNLLIYVPFDQDFSGTNRFIDVSGNGNNLTFTTPVNFTWTNTSSFSVNGSNSSLLIINESQDANFNDRPNITLSGLTRLMNFTVCSWFNLSNRTIDGGFNFFVIAQAGASAPRLADATWDPNSVDGRLRMTGYDGAGNANTLLVNYGTFHYGIWEQWCFRMNNTRSLPDNLTEIRIYRNGTLQNSTTYTNTTGSWGGFIQGRWTSNGNVSMGIDEWRFYDVALTDEQISNLSNRTLLSSFTPSSPQSINFSINGSLQLNVAFNVSTSQPLQICQPTVIPNCTVNVCFPRSSLIPPS